VQGYGRATQDLDSTYATDAENLERLAGVLLALHARLRGVAEEVPFIPDARAPRRVQLLTLDTDDGGRHGACATSVCASLDRRDGEPADTHHAAAARRDPRADVPAHGLPLTRPG
jgi:hypothetical protein